MKTTRPLKPQRFLQVMQIKGVDVYVHWSVLLTAGILLLGAVKQPVLTFVVLVAYLSVLLIHECGHLVAAHWRGCEVYSIELYPIYGITRFETPWSRFDHCLIAWGGVVAQAVVALPLITWVEIFGYTPFEALNAALALLGFFSAGVALLNLLPVPPLDGVTAWGLIPALVERVRTRSHKGTSERRFPR